jgi:PhoH-like ATPase
MSNGLTIAIEKLKGEELFGHVTLTKGERSEVATLASKIFV